MKFWHKGWEGYSHFDPDEGEPIRQQQTPGSVWWVLHGPPSPPSIQDYQLLHVMAGQETRPMSGMSLCPQVCHYFRYESISLRYATISGMSLFHYARFSIYQIWHYARYTTMSCIIHLYTTMSYMRYAIMSIHQVHRNVNTFIHRE